MDVEKLYKTCYMQVYSYVMTLCGSPHTAEEITEETFFKAMTASEIASFDSRSSELTWLCAIAKNLYTDEMRKQSRLSGLDENIISGDNVESAVEDSEMSFRIHKVLHTLEEPYKEVFELRVFGELTFAQIGKIFGKTENWARVTYHRAKLTIRERM